MNDSWLSPLYAFTLSTYLCCDALNYTVHMLVFFDVVGYWCVHELRVGPFNVFISSEASHDSQCFDSVSRWAIETKLNHLSVVSPATQPLFTLYIFQFIPQYGVLFCLSESVSGVSLSFFMWRDLWFFDLKMEDARQWDLSVIVTRVTIFGWKHGLLLSYLTVSRNFLPHRRGIDSLMHWAPFVDQRRVSSYR